MNGKLPVNNKKGALMLMLLVVIVIGGIVALRMLPQEDVIARREKEENLYENLSQIREAFDLECQASDTSWNPFPDYDGDGKITRFDIASSLIRLASDGYLRDGSFITPTSLVATGISDPTVPNYLWGSSDEKYWQVSANLASNTSFELEDPSDPTLIASWTKAPDTEAATVTQYLDDPVLDDYPHQNKLGAPLQGGGTSLMIVK